MIDQALLRHEFPHNTDLIYLNHAAVSPWPQRTSDAVCRFAGENCRTGARNYTQWVAKEAWLREQLCNLIHAPAAADIALLKNTSEALSVVACGIDWKHGDNVVSTNEEFPSNRIPWQAQAHRGVRFIAVPIQTHAAEDALIAACDQHTRIMSVSSVQYGSGLRLDLVKLGQHCRANNILFCVDAIQSIGAYEFDVQAIQADFVMADAHKWMLGPEGIAVFYCSARVRPLLKLYQFGWHMVEHAGDYDRPDWQAAAAARRFECGSPNMLGIHALSASLSLLEEAGMGNIEAAILARRRRLVDQLQVIRGLELLAPPSRELLSAIITFKFPGIDHAALHRKLIDKGVICAQRAGGIRFSPHFYTPDSKIDRAVEILNAII